MNSPELILTAFLEPSRLASLLVWRLDRSGLALACASRSGFDPGAHIESLLLDPSPEAAHPGREAIERLAIQALREPSDISLGPLGREPLESGSSMMRRQSSLGFSGEEPMDAQMGFIDLLVHNPNHKASAERALACRQKIPQAIERMRLGFERLSGANCRYLGAIEPDAWDDYRERARLIQALIERDAIGAALPEGEARADSRRL